MVISAERSDSEERCSWRSRQGPHRKVREAAPACSLVCRAMASLDAFQLKGIEGAGWGTRGDMKEMKTREEETSSETFNKPRKTQRWLEFPSDLPHHLGTAWGNVTVEGGRPETRSKWMKGAPQAPARTVTGREFTQTDNRQTMALRED